MDVHLRIVSGFEAGKIMPEERTSNGHNNERGKKYPAFVGAPFWESRNDGSAAPALSAECVWRSCLRWIRCRILLSRTHFPSTYSAKRDSATPVALARDILARLWL